MIKKILVPVNGSEHGFKALDLASDLAEKYKASLLLLHVMMKRELPEAVRRFAEVEHIQGSPEHVYEEVLGKNILGEAKKRAQEKGMTSIQNTIQGGDPAKIIVEVARSKDVDLIVMGTRGLSEASS